MKRSLFLLYGIFCYAVFLGVFAYAIGFLGSFATPTQLDGQLEGAFWKALCIDLGLLVLFAVQHSVMARPAFKRAWTKIVPQQLERSTYVLFSSVALIILFAFWQPLGGPIWDVLNPAARGAIYMFYAVGWMVLFLATCLIDHYDLFGLRQVWTYFRGNSVGESTFVTPGLYKLVRHPIYVGWIMIAWFTPVMTLAHLVYAVISTAYILAAIQLEERDLIAVHGESYRRYKRAVPSLIPRFGRSAEAAGLAEQT